MNNSWALKLEDVVVTGRSEFDSIFPAMYNLREIPQMTRVSFPDYISKNFNKQANRLVQSCVQKSSL